FGNYDLASALADLVDNSLKAKAHNIGVLCLFGDGSPEVRVVDDGHGMSLSELHAAMRPASQDPSEERSPDDLGRFGWGMKSASFSQCTKLTVITTRNGETSGAMWDLDTLDNWQMGVLSRSEIAILSADDFDGKDGTEIIWSNCDRLSENNTLSEPDFNAIVTHARNRLALVFHKYLSGQVRGKKLSMTLNGQTIDAYDPFYSQHNATQDLPPEILSVKGKKIKISPYILPHFSKLKSAEHDRLAGSEGFLKNQGFYVYRNHRLIISGTWFRLVKYGELAQLVRIGVDIPNSLDDLWKITVDKSDAQLPAILRDRLKQIITGIRRRASNVHRSKGGRISSGSKKIDVWVRYVHGGEINYHINREHPLVAALLEAEDVAGISKVTAALQVIEQCFPVEAFLQDAVDRPDDIHQAEAQVEKFRALLDAALPILLVGEDGDFGRLEKKLSKTEPFASNWKPVEEFLKEKGWVNASS
ncbi:MAG: ATP-binding protein, partial [Deltaproteobacteria bacterium]|nr:ATP-binding protein [Deltaproteobacteria bacterium]